MLKTTLKATAVASMMGLFACSSPTDPTSSSGAVNLTANPSPASAQPSHGVTYILQGDANNPDKTLEYPFESTFTTSIAETGGAALEITAITLKVQQATGGIITPPTNGQVEHYQFVSQASGKNLPANGQVSVGFQVWFALPNQRRECVATVGFTFIDRKGTPNDTSDDVAFSKSLDVQIQ